MSTTLAWYREGGSIMLLIALVGAAGLAILVERVYVIVIRSKNSGRSFIEQIIQLVRGGKIDEAIKLCAASNAALPDMGLVILRSRSRDEADLQNVATAASLSVIPQLTHRLQYLTTLAIVAVLTGVLGTVLGVRGAFAVVGSGAADPRLWNGLAAALTPTAFGTAVAIVLVLGRGYLVSQAEAITEHINELSARLINALIDRPDVRLGHR